MENKFKPFQRVLVKKHAGQPWYADLFSNIDSFCMYVCVGGVWKYCIPYEGNEHLLGTTDEPKPKRWRAEKDGYYYYILTAGFEVRRQCEHNDLWCDECYNSGNYFKTEKEAEEAAEKIKKLLKGEMVRKESKK